METFEVVSGYDRSKNPPKIKVRWMTVEEAKNLVSGSHPEFLDVNNQLRDCKVNGKVRTWKKDPNRVEVPIKYGLYEYATFHSMIRYDNTGYTMERLVVRVDEKAQEPA